MMADILAQRSKLREEFDRLVESTLHDVMGYARSLCKGDSGLAHDLYMDAWMLALEKFPLMTGMNEVKFAVYLQRAISFNLSKYRRSRYQYSLDAGWDDPDRVKLEPPELWVEAEFGYGPELSPALSEALSDLSPWDLRAFALFADGIHEIEAAAELEVEIDDYLAAVAEIQQQLREALESAPDIESNEATDVLFLTRQRLVALAGLSWYRIERLLPHLARQGLEPVRKHNAAGWVSTQYPIAMVPVLKQYRLPQAAGDWLTVKEISREVKRPQDWVERRIWRYERQKQQRLDNRGRLTWHYPPTVVAILKTESDAQSSVPPAGSWMTAGGIARALGRSNTYVTGHIGQYTHLAEDRLDSRGRILPHYPPGVFIALGGDPASLPAPQSEQPISDPWFTATAISRELGRSEGWVSRHLIWYQVLAQPRIALNGHELPHYPEVVLLALRIEADPTLNEPAHDWRTVRAMARLLGRTQRWVMNRIGPFEHLSHWITGPNGHQWKVYHPVAFSVLLADSLRVANLPPIGDWLTLTVLARRLGRSRKWAREHLVPDSAEDRISHLGQPVACYPPETEADLASQSVDDDSHPFIGDWYTIRGIADAIGRPWAWVAARIDPFAHLAQPRRDVSGKISVCYPPHVKEALEEISTAEASLIAPARLWLTATAMARMLGRDKSWVFARLPEFEYLGQQMYDSTGKLTMHYPLVVLDALSEQSEAQQRRDLLVNWKQAS